MDFGAIYTWIMAHIPLIMSLVGALIVLDEVILQIWPSPTQSSIAYRVKEILVGLLNLLKKFTGTVLPSTKD